MDTDQIKTKVTELATQLLKKMGFEAQVEATVQQQTEGRENSVSLAVATKGDDSGVLIGKQGANLEAIEHLLRAMLGKNTDSPRINLILDINGYRKTKTQHLVDAAKEAAARVVTTARAEALYPMTSYERRLVHMELASYKNVETESIGEGLQRRIVIKPSSSLSF